MDYVHKVEKGLIPVCNIMGVNVAAINMPWLLKFTEKNIHDLSGDYMCVSNVHTIVTAYEDIEYRAIQNGGIMALPDGMPLSIVGHKRGYKMMKRIAGPSYMNEVFELSIQKGYSHFFYGSTEMTLKKMRHSLEKNFPGIKIVGMYSPPFHTMTEKEDRIILKQINESNADFIWVGLGAPKQEKWMALHQGKVKGFMVGVGAGFDYIAGNIKRAPEWLQKNSLEWLYRLFQDPKRLFSRYMHTNTKFIWHAIIRRR